MAHRRTAVVGCCLAVLAVSVAGCSSSGAPAQAPPGGSNGPVSASSATPDSTAPSSTAASTAPPLSNFEADPAVEAYRAWAAQAGRTVNTGHYTSTALQRLMTPSFAKTMKRLLGTDVGSYYPGPIPFTPLTLVSPSAATRRADGCLISTGFAENPKSHKPAAARKVLPVEVGLVYQSGHWLMNALNNAPSTSCAGVKIGTPRW